jgi:hypothetical protein
MAKPNRRAILILLVLPKRLVGEIERQLRMPRPGDARLAPFRRFWSAHVDVLERHLDRMDGSTQTESKARRSV